MGIYNVKINFGVSASSVFCLFLVQITKLRLEKGQRERMRELVRETTKVTLCRDS